MTGVSHADRSMRFAADVHVLAGVRAFADRTAEELGSQVDRNDLILVVGELTANAARHQRTEAELVLTPLPDGGLRVEVCDGDPAMPHIVAAGPQGRTAHWGLVLVEALSSGWGAERWGGGKRVWADLPAVSPPSAGRPG